MTLELKFRYLEHDEAQPIWKRFVATVRGVDHQAATKLVSTADDAYLIAEQPVFDARDQPRMSRLLDIYVDNDEELLTLRHMQSLLQKAASHSEIDEVVAHQAQDGLRLEIVVNRKKYMSTLPSAEELAAAVSKLRESDRVANDGREVIDGVKLSPIEASFYRALNETKLLFSPQARMVEGGRIKYRVDFLVFFNGRAVAVELDGHQFHSSRDARSKDTSRDRFLKARGIDTIRFTGSQIHKDPQGCIFELIDCLTGAPGSRV